MYEISFVIRAWNEFEHEKERPNPAGWRFTFIDTRTGKERYFQNLESLIQHIQTLLAETWFDPPK